MRHKIFSNIFTNWLCFVVSLIIAFFLTPFLVHRLGNIAYGIWILINYPTVSYLRLFDIGISGAVLKYIAEYSAKNDQIKLNETFNTSLFLYSLLGIIVILVIIVVSPKLPALFKIPFAYIAKARLIFLIIGLNVALSLPLGIFAGFLRGINRFDLPNLSSVLTLIITSILIVISLMKGGDIVDIALITLFVSILGYAMNFIFLIKLNPFLKFKRSFITAEMVNQIINFGKFIFLITLTLQISGSMGLIIIGIFLSPIYVTFFSIGKRFTDIMRQVVVETTCVVFPLASELDSRGEKEKLINMLTTGTKCILLLVSAMGVLLMFFGKDFIKIWLGESYLVIVPVLIILVAGDMLSLPFLIATSTGSGIGRQKAISYIRLLKLIIELILSVISIKLYGIVGVALSVATAEILCNLIISIYVCHVLDMDYLSYLRKSFLRPILSYLPVVMVLYLFFIYCKSTFNNYLQLAITSGFFTLLFAISAFIFALNAQERKLFLGLLPLSNRKRP